MQCSVVKHVQCSSFGVAQKTYTLCAVLLAWWHSVITLRRACAKQGLCDRLCPFILFIYLFIKGNRHTKQKNNNMPPHTLSFDKK